MSIVGNIIAGFFIPLAGAIIKVPLAMLLIVAGKAVADPPPNGASFLIGVLQDIFGYVVAIWLTNMLMVRFIGNINRLAPTSFVVRHNSLAELEPHDEHFRCDHHPMA